VAPAGPASAQPVRDVFRSVTPSVVVIRATGQDVTASGQTRSSETGSGVLTATDGKVMTAAHVVHAMDEIVVDFIGGEAVGARVVSSEPAADLNTGNFGGPMFSMQGRSSGSPATRKRSRRPRASR
jgi:S1-C subfamily serine protease